MKLTSLLATCALALSSFHSLSAASAIFSGDTTGQPTYNRTVEDGTDLSFFGSNVPFSLFLVTVNNTGVYNFSLASSTPSVHDTFITLYSPSFSALDPETNFVIANDNTNNSNPDLGSSFSTNLTAGTNYYLAVSGFTNDDYGPFSGTVSGIGANTPSVSAVPEPSTVGLLTIAAAGTMLLLKRRRLSCLS